MIEDFHHSGKGNVRKLGFNPVQNRKKTLISLLSTRQNAQPIFGLQFQCYIVIERGNTVPKKKIDIFLLVLSSNYSWDFNEGV